MVDSHTMAQRQDIQLEAAIRYYGDPGNTIHLVNPALINDFVNVESFNFEIAHTIFQIKDGHKTEVPIQVFGISEDREELLNPEKRRIFEKKRRSDVIAEILATREKAEIDERKKNKQSHHSEKDNAVLANQANEPVASNLSKAQDLKAIQKKIKEDAKNYAKSTDKEILMTKLNKMERRKLDYDDDRSELEKKQREINDLNTQNILKDQNLAELKKKQKEINDLSDQSLAEFKKKHEEEIATLKAKLEKNKEVLIKSKHVIQQLQNRSESFVLEPSVLENSSEGVQQDSITMESITSSHSKELLSPGQEIDFSNVPFDDSSLHYESQKSDEFVGEVTADQDRDKSDADSCHEDPKTKKKFSNSTDQNEGVKDPQMNTVPSGLKNIDLAMNLQGSFHCSQSSSTNKKFLSIDSDDEDFFKNILKCNTEVIAKKKSSTKTFEKSKDNTFGQQKGKTMKANESDSEKENRKTDKTKKRKRRVDFSSDEESAKKDACKKSQKISGSRRTNDYNGTKKYKRMESSDSDIDENKKPRRYTRASDKEYDSDFLIESDKTNYKSYTEEGGKERHMFHLRYDISIRYKWWAELKKEFDMKEWMRMLLHAMFKEEDLINKVFNPGSCKSERLPGRERTEFTLAEKAVIRATFFCRVDKVVTSRKEARMHKDHWKTYVSEHINALIEAEKRLNRKREEAKKKKKKASQAGRKHESSASSEDA